jgi:UDP-glucose 4-epimerase
LNENDDRVVGAPQKIRWTYSDAKALEEAIAHSLFVQKNLPVTTIRFFNTVGPRQTGRYGMVVPRFIKSAIQNKTIEVYGSGDQTRVFCHVSDAVTAVHALMATEKSIGEVFNVGGLGEISINNLAQKIIQNLNSNSKIKHVSYESAYAPGFEDMARRIPDISKLEKFLNWKPTKSLSEIISDTAEYIQNNDNN